MNEEQSLDLRLRLATEAVERFIQELAKARSELASKQAQERQLRESFESEHQRRALETQRLEKLVHGTLPASVQAAERTVQAIKLEIERHAATRQAERHGLRVISEPADAA